MRRIFGFIFVLLFVVSGSVFAQNAQELRVGSFLSGNLGSGQEIWYSVRATEAGILTVETTSNIDTYLEAYDSQRNIIAEDDDGGEGNNAKIELLVTANTTYLFKLRGYSSSTTGQFRIFAAHRPMPAMTELRIGSFHNGQINRGEDYWFTLRTAESGMITIETTGSTDTFMDVYNDAFALIASDDDGGEGNNARVELVVRAGATYYIKIRGFSSSTTGPYRVMAATRTLPTPVQLRLGSFVSANLSPGGEFWYSVRTTGRGRLIVETTGSTDTYMEAYTDNYTLITEDDDGGEGYNARISIAVEANRTYIFKVRGYSSSTSGAFRVFASME